MSRQPAKYIKYRLHPDSLTLLAWSIVVIACFSIPGIAAVEQEPAKKKAVETSAPASTYQLPALLYQSQSVNAGSVSNSFNRLMKVVPRHLPPNEDGIHDPTSDAAQILQPPLEAFADLPKTQSDLGNGIQWVQAVDEGKIQPRWDINDLEARPTTLDLDIVRVPKGSMPNELFPHRQHSLMLDCANCHPDIFIAKKGANLISMAANLLGQKCGVCHGKVAFPFSTCNRCHSQQKAVAPKGASRK